MINMQNPLAEIFGFPAANTSVKAQRYRAQRLCPFNNKVPNCTKDKASAPLGVCSVQHNARSIITCPVRFREDWLIAENATHFFFGEKTMWTSLTEIRLSDKEGQSAGNVDFVLVSYDQTGRVTDFGSLEVQGVYISGNMRNPFDAYMAAPSADFSWEGGGHFPRPDFLSSSRKRLVPQVLYKGAIFKYWGKKQAVALQKDFFETLPVLPQVPPQEADIAWFLYDLLPDHTHQTLRLTWVDTVYTDFNSALQIITTPQFGEVLDFIKILQGKLDEHLESTSPDTLALSDIIAQ